MDRRRVDDKGEWATMSLLGVQSTNGMCESFIDCMQRLVECDCKKIATSSSPSICALWSELNVALLCCSC